MNEIIKIIRSFKRKINMNIYINCLIDIAMMYLILATAILAVANLYYLKGLNKGLLLIALLCFVIATVGFVLNKKDSRYSAIYIDKLGFDSRFITLLQIEEGHVKKFILNETVQLFKRKKPKYEFSINRRWPIVLVLLLIFSSYYFLSLDNRLAVKEKYEADNPMIMEIENVQESLDEYVKELGADKKDRDYLNKELKKIKDDLKKSNYKMVEKSAEMLSKKINHIKDEESQEIKKKIMEALNIDVGLNNIDKSIIENAMKNIDMEKLMNEMNDLLKNIDSESLKELAKEIQNSMSQGDIESLLKSIGDIEGTSPGSYSNLSSSVENLKELAASQSGDYKPGGT